MKVSAFAPLLLSSTVFAASVRSNALKSRQASMKRGLVDVCVGLDLDVKLLDILPEGKSVVAGHLDLCLCLSVLPDFCKSNPIGKNVVNWLGEDKAHDFFSNLISGQPGHQQCHYPEHSDPFCDVKKPCHFGCKDGFVPDNKDHPTQCVCPAPHTVCNGVCGDFPHGCASPTPAKPAKRDLISAAAPTPVVSNGGPKNADDIINLLLKQGLIANVADLVWIKEGLAAALRVGGVHGKPCQDFLDLLVKQGAIVGVPGILGLWERLGLGLSILKRDAPKSADDIIALLLKQNLLAHVDDIAWIKESLAAALQIGGINGKPCHDFLDLLVKQGAIVGVKDILGLWERLGLSLSVLKRDGPHTAADILDLLLKQGLIANIADVIFAKEGLIAFLHIGDLSDKQRDDFLLLLLKQGLIVGVKDILALKERLGLGLSVLKRGDEHTAHDILDLLVKQGLIANIANLVFAKEGLLAFLHLGPLSPQQCDDFLLLLLKQGLIVGVKDLLALKERLGLGLSVLRRGDDHKVDDILNAIVAQGLLVHIEDLALVKEGLLALVHVGQLFGKDCDDFLLVLLKQGLFVGVKDLLALKEKLGLGLSVL